MYIQRIALNIRKMNIIGAMNRNYFYSFTQSERRGFIVLVVLLLLLAGVLFVKPFWKSDKENVTDFSAFADSIERYEQQIVSESFAKDDVVKYEHKYRPRQLKPFTFDPNTLDKNGWVAMGFSEKQALAVVNYRKKGGHFYKKEDVKNIFFVGEEEYKQMEPYIEIMPQESKEHISLSTPKKIFELELNTADTLDLQQLYGIGSVFSKRIVKYRTLLGGFYTKEQLMEVYGFTEELYEKVSPYITVDTSKLYKLNINTDDVSRLKRHPYLDYYQAKAIVKYRQTAGAFDTVTDLRNVVLIDKNTFEKIKPYLSVR